MKTLARQALPACRALSQLPYITFNSLAGTTFGFTGQHYDSELGLYYFKMRHYSGKLGRFLQTDSIGFTGEDFNLYTYVQNSPLRYTDPMGTLPVWLVELGLCQFQKFYSAVSEVLFSRLSEARQQEGFAKNFS